MNEKKLTKQEVQAYLSDYMPDILRELQEARKFTAVHTYTSTLNSFTKFCGGNKNPLTINEVFTSARLKAYQEWLVKKELSWNTVSTYMRTLRAIYNRIFSLMYADESSPESNIPGFFYNPRLFGDIYTKVESRTKRALTEKQTQQLLTTNFRNLPRNLRRPLAYFRLMFLFRGMPFIDLAHLRKRDMRGNTITYCRHKTGCQLVINIPKQAVGLIREFMDTNAGSIYLFPILDNELKDARKQHLNYLDALRRFNMCLSKLASHLLPGSKISSYTARHTWATLSYHLGTPVGVISKALGHSSIRVTETYLKPFEDERIDQANDKLITSVVQYGIKKSRIYKGLINTVL